MSFQRLIIKKTSILFDLLPIAFFQNNLYMSMHFITGVAAQSCLWEQLELMVWYLSRLETSQSDLSESVSSFRYTHMITSTKFWLNEGGDWQRQWPKWNMTLNKELNWSGCKRLALIASLTHGLIAQSVRASERNSVSWA